MVDVNMCGSFITSQIAYKATYHNHKENMAWVATAFYVPAIIVFGSRAHDMCQFWGGKCVITLILLLAACLILAFVCTQFRLRWKAADDVEGLRRAHVYLCTITMVPQEQWSEVRCSSQWPPLIQVRIEKRTQEEQRTFKKAKTAFKTLLLLRWKEVDDRWQTEIPSYLAILLATVVAVTLVWVK